MQLRDSNVANHVDHFFLWDFIGEGREKRVDSSYLTLHNADVEAEL